MANVITSFSTGFQIHIRGVIGVERAGGTYIDTGDLTNNKDVNAEEEQNKSPNYINKQKLHPSTAQFRSRSLSVTLKRWQL